MLAKLPTIFLLLLLQIICIFGDDYTINSDNKSLLIAAGCFWCAGESVFVLSHMYLQTTRTNRSYNHFSSATSIMKSKRSRYLHQAYLRQYRAIADLIVLIIHHIRIILDAMKSFSSNMILYRLHTN